MATIKEIAQRAGVSTTTVSNVIHGKTKKVSPANIQKIENLIREMGYVQKMGLRVLNKEKSQLIAVVINYHKDFRDSLMVQPECCRPCSRRIPSSDTPPSLLSAETYRTIILLLRAAA